jgi:hypothetical protein
MYADVRRKGTLGTLYLHIHFVLHVIDEIIMIANDYRVQGGRHCHFSNDVPIIHKTRVDDQFAFENNFEYYRRIRDVANLSSGLYTDFIY